MTSATATRAAARNPRPRLDDLAPAIQAGILCNDARFQRFAAHSCGVEEHDFTPSAAAQFLRMHCEITSRRDLNTDPAATRKLASLRTAFDAWAGRLPAPR
ncbi:hypothetical protein [Roseicitreum antarcticum]|uniref:Uncharacterized protein n=1 Tax=Roseicitreum antarcticum TaxID=564137 RepID=A0A1H2WA89_9RHOB|nr:hypothetical protein [Roseicitreum antarcticum]SDW77435.1 hypothetical protein SAMN04488238_103316 [Roseicitreum antarcticum]